jgi:hypothetical protein
MPRNRSRLTTMAGWLFADLFLVLLIAGLAAIPATTANSANGGRRPTPTPSPTISSSTTPRPSHTPAPAPTAGLDPKYLDFQIPLTPDQFRAGDQQDLLKDVTAKLNAGDPGHLQVGFVLVFAYGADDPADINQATTTATQALHLLQSKQPQFGAAQGLGYWGAPGDDFEFKIFLLYR